MKRDYRELVGLQATFDNVLPRYHLVHFYRWKRIPVVEQIAVLKGYDLERKEAVADIIVGLRSAYQPAILSTWKSETVLRVSQYLQFEAEATPTDIGLEGIWHVEP